MKKWPTINGQLVLITSLFGPRNCVVYIWWRGQPVVCKLLSWIYTNQPCRFVSLIFGAFEAVWTRSSNFDAPKLEVVNPLQLHGLVDCIQTIGGKRNQSWDSCNTNGQMKMKTLPGSTHRLRHLPIDAHSLATEFPTRKSVKYVAARSMWKRVDGHGILYLVGHLRGT